ncbi:hypothetical protein TNCV_4862871 [Trichonephila clavipes]|nr:hypothetical protein TNCV_4862871 [Trichonephila clavipes]
MATESVMSSSHLTSDDPPRKSVETPKSTHWLGVEVCVSVDSSVGRAVDCRCFKADIHRSLVRLRLDGMLLF